MDDAATELQAAIADAALLLLRLEKYQRGAAEDVAALQRSLTATGRAARRAHRDGASDASMTALRDQGRALVEALEAIVAEVQASAPYRAAVEAYGRGDQSALRPLLLDVFAGLTVASPARVAFAPVEWSGRRGPRPLTDVVAALETTRREGLLATDDPLEPGLDPALPAVLLGLTWPDGAPVGLSCDLAGVARDLLVGPTGLILVHQPRLRVPFDVVFCLERDAVDDWVDDPVRYHADLAPLLEARGFVTRTADTPATP